MCQSQPRRPINHRKGSERRKKYYTDWTEIRRILSISRNASRSRRRWSHIRLRRTTKRRRIRGNKDGCGGGRRTGRVGNRGRRRGRGRSHGDGGGGGRRGGRALPHCSAVPGCKPRTGTPRPTPSPPPPPTLRWTPFPSPSLFFRLFSFASSHSPSFSPSSSSSSLLIGYSVRRQVKKRGYRGEEEIVTRHWGCIVICV